MRIPIPFIPHWCRADRLPPRPSIRRHRHDLCRSKGLRPAPRTNSFSGRILLLAILLAILPAPNSTHAADQREREFETTIRPVLIQSCLKCHGGENVSGELRVDSLEHLKQGGDRGPAIVPGNAQKSLLIRAIRYQDEDLQMPPDKQLDEQVVRAFEKWIDDGAVWPQQVTLDSSNAARHWAFQPLQRPAVPQITAGNIASPIDAFVADKQRQHGLTPAAPAAARQLVRRLYLDLLGIPPTFSEQQFWATPGDTQQMRRLIDFLLAHPAYGERWARHWLDVARYADTKGYVFQESREYPFAYTYRDWVIRALNSDRPYDDFLIQQLAADLAEPESKELPAMGFLTLGRRFLNNSHDIIDDRIDVVTRGTMGLTVTCARCHDHKYDPIPTADYYSLYGVFASCEEPSKPPQAMVLFDRKNPVTPQVFIRGNPSRRGDRVPRQFLQVLAGPERKPFQNGSGRLELAEAIANPDNPLTARVLVNRVWGEHFGRPLVSTPSDFGLRSTPPDHPQLLDYLACELIDSGWSIKHLHRLILNSATYQQSTEADAKTQTADPENRWLTRMNRRRLAFEPMRDSLLSAAGLLDTQMYGEPARIDATPPMLRRTIYGRIDRQNLPSLFRVFDFASPDTHHPQRHQTSVPQQTLFLRNSPFVMELAEQLAASVAAHSAANSERIERLWRQVLARDPDPLERDWSLQFLEARDAKPATPTGSPWQYGYGRLPQSELERVDFRPLPHWTGQAWQGGPQLPDPKLGWVMLRATGGHPGNRQHAAVIRWRATQAGTVQIFGRLNHASSKGDGVRAAVVHNGRQVIQYWDAAASELKTTAEPFSIQAGDTLDFVVDSRGSGSFDSYDWRPVIKITTHSGQHMHSASAEFHGPQPQPLSRLAQLSQLLLISNEFLFVD